MRDYPVKKTVKLSQELVTEICRKVVGNGSPEGKGVVASCKGLSRIYVEIKDPKTIMVDTVSEETDNKMEVIRMFNDLMEALTGYTVKERKKLMSKS